ncbi:unnamed protein product, partial [Ectocarpus sp. 4 AP-2014]
SVSPSYGCRRSVRRRDRRQVRVLKVSSRQPRLINRGVVPRPRACVWVRARRRREQGVLSRLYHRSSVLSSQSLRNSSGCNSRLLLLIDPIISKSKSNLVSRYYYRVPLSPLEIVTARDVYIAPRHSDRG